MLNYIVCISIALFSPQVIEASSVKASIKTNKSSENKVISVQTACSRDSMMTLMILRDPFQGNVYARGFPDECQAQGNGSREIRLTIHVNNCGVKVSESEDGSSQYDLYLYVQYDKHVQQAVDDLILVKCIPQDVVVTRKMAPGASGEVQPRTKNARETSEVSPLSVDCWMDILKGKMPSAFPITDYVDVGDDLTMIVKIRHATDGVEAKVTDCVASDGSKQSQQELIDSNGCTVDPAIMPNLQEKYLEKTGVKIIYTTFQAFKFPDRDSLHLQCRVIVCNKTCPLESCKQKIWSSQPRLSRNIYAMEGPVFRKMDVFNSVEVKNSVLEVEQPLESTSNVKETAAMAGAGSAGLPALSTDLFCLSSTRLVIVIGMLLGVLLVSLVVTICMCVRARELRRRLLQRQSFPYGRVHDIS